MLVILRASNDDTFHFPGMGDGILLWCSIYRNAVQPLCPEWHEIVLQQNDQRHYIKKEKKKE
jgi:hypothetical protein